VSRLTTIKPRLPGITSTRLQAQAVSAEQSWRAGKTTTERGYGWEWQKAREVHLRDNPLCAYCERLGYITAASVVDHKTPHRGDPILFWNKLNWQSLCKACHDSIKQAEESRLNKY